MTGLLSITLKEINIYAVMDFSLVIVGASLLLTRHGYPLVTPVLFREAKKILDSRASEGIVIREAVPDDTDKVLDIRNHFQQ